MGCPRILSHLLWLSVLLPLVACNGGTSGGGGGPTAEGEPASIGFRLGAFDPAALGGAGSGSLAAGGASQPLATTARLYGQILIVPGVGNERTLTFDVQVNLDAIQKVTLENVNLQPGDYTIYVLLNVNSSANQFGGVTGHQVFRGGPNDLPVILYPLVSFGPALASVQAFRNLSTLSIDYPDDVATYTDPRVAITITYTAANGTTTTLSRVFSINPGAIEEAIRLFLTAGAYHVDVTFFNGAIVKDVEGDADVDVPPPGDPAPKPVPLVKITASTNYSLEPATGTATFIFPIPDLVVDEVGGVGSDIDQRLRVRATLVGPENPLVEQNLSLGLVADGSHYTSTLTVPNFVPGMITWSLTFTALNYVDPDEQIGYCTETVDTTQTADTFDCPLVLLSRDDVSSFPVAWVQIRVSDRNGDALPGAVVTVFPLNADGSPRLDQDGNAISSPLGITTRSSDPALNGTLDSFLLAGNYAFQAAVAGWGSSSQLPVSLGMAEPTSFSLQVLPFDTTEPNPVTDLQAVAGNGLVNLSWVNPAEDFHHAVVFRTASNDCTGFEVAHSAATSAMDSGLINDVEYTYAVCAVDAAGNRSTPVSMQAIPLAPVTVATIKLTPSRTTRPTVRSDYSYDATAPVQVRIPPLFKPSGSEGNPDVPGLDVLSGNPDRFLLMLKLGRVTCVYLGGKLDRAIEGIPVEDFWRDAFKSPLCSNHKRAGDLVSIQPYGSTGDADDDHDGRPEIGARVLVGDPRESLTEIRVTIEVVQP
jgi:hypothetical protein